MAWFGVRSLYRFGVKADGTNIFEERVVCFEAADSDEAHSKAQRESVDYARDNGFDWYPVQVSYEQDGDNLIDGYEVWSELYESSEDLDIFWQNRYARYEYHFDLESLRVNSRPIGFLPESPSTGQE